jgi:hypothetical protein
MSVWEAVLHRVCAWRVQAPACLMLASAVSLLVWGCSSR